MHFCQTTRPITKFGTLTRNKQYHYQRLPFRFGTYLWHCWKRDCKIEQYSFPQSDIQYRKPSAGN